MSYSIYLRAPVCPTCNRRGDEPGHCPDPTYNLTPIFDAALTGGDLPNPGVSEAEVVLFGKATERPRGLRLLSGRKASDTVQNIMDALVRLRDPANRERLVALEPPNKWGDLAGATFVMGRLLDLALGYPDNVWEVR